MGDLKAYSSLFDDDDFETEEDQDLDAEMQVDSTIFCGLRFPEEFIHWCNLARRKVSYLNVQSINCSVDEILDE
jgi:hypothetical protein